MAILPAAPSENEPELVDYDPDWPWRYAGERESIREALGPLLVALEHIGGTAVPGMDGRSMVDLLAGVTDEKAAAWVEEPLARLDYRRLTDRVDGFGEAVYERDGQFCLWVAVYRGPEWCQHLALRDHLRRNESDRLRYSTLKRRALRGARTASGTYEASKSAFLESTFGEITVAPGTIRPGSGARP